MEIQEHLLNAKKLHIFILKYTTCKSTTKLFARITKYSFRQIMISFDFYLMTSLKVLQHRIVKLF
jgi:UDP-N-acetylglucosamine pyrophosphorylase